MDNASALPPNSAPAFMVYCPRCATPLVTRPVSDKLRRVCPACGYIHFTDPKVGVGVLVVHEGRVLLVRRAVRPEIGKWSIPAGFLDQGEDPQVTAVREAQEETGLQVTIDHLLDVYYTPIGQRRRFCLHPLPRHPGGRPTAAGRRCRRSRLLPPGQLARAGLCQHARRHKAAGRECVRT